MRLKEKANSESRLLQWGRNFDRKTRGFFPTKMLLFILPYDSASWRVAAKSVVRHIHQTSSEPTVL